MGNEDNDADTKRANKQIHVRKKDAGHSLQHECEEVSSGTDMLSNPYLIILLLG